MRSTHPPPAHQEPARAASRPIGTAAVTTMNPRYTAADRQLAARLKVGGPAIRTWENLSIVVGPRVSPRSLGFVEQSGRSFESIDAAMATESPSDGAPCAQGLIVLARTPGHLECPPAGEYLRPTRGCEQPPFMQCVAGNPPIKPQFGRDHRPQAASGGSAICGCARSSCDASIRSQSMAPRNNSAAIGTNGAS